MHQQLDFMKKQAAHDHEQERMLQESNQRLRHQVDDLETRLMEAREEAGRHVEQVRHEERAQHESFVAQAQAQLALSQREASELRQKLAQVTAMSETLAAESNELKIELDEVEIDKARQASQLAEKSSMVMEMEGELHRLREQNDEVRSQLTMFQLGREGDASGPEQDAELEREREKISGLTKRLASMQDENAGLTASVKHFRDLASENEARLMDLSKVAEAERKQQAINLQKVEDAANKAVEEALNESMNQGSGSSSSSPDVDAIRAQAMEERDVTWRQQWSELEAFCTQQQEQINQLNTQVTQLTETAASSVATTAGPPSPVGSPLVSARGRAPSIDSSEPASAPLSARGRATSADYNIQAAALEEREKELASAMIRIDAAADEQARIKAEHELSLQQLRETLSRIKKERDNLQERLLVTQAQPPSPVRIPPAGGRGPGDAAAMLDLMESYSPETSGKSGRSAPDPVSSSSSSSTGGDVLPGMGAGAAAAGGGGGKTTSSPAKGMLSSLGSAAAALPSILSSRSADYGDSLPLGSNRRGSGSSTGSAGGGVSEKTGRARKSSDSLLPMHGTYDDDDNDDDEGSIGLSPATRNLNDASIVYGQNMEYIEKQEDEIAELREELKDLTALNKRHEDNISDLEEELERLQDELDSAKTTAVRRGSGGTAGEEDDDGYLWAQREQSYRDRISDLEEQVQALVGQAQEEILAAPDAAISIRRQESVEAIEQLDAMKLETDELRNQLASRRQEDLAGALKLHAVRPQGGLQLIEFLASNADVHSSLLELYLRAIYTAHNPAKLDSIDKILEAYEGEEQQLIDELYERYDIQHSDGGAQEGSKLILDGPASKKRGAAGSSDSKSRSSGSSASGSVAGADSSSASGPGSVVSVSPAVEKIVTTASSQRVSSLFWAAVMKTTIWALLLSNGALLLTANNGGGMQVCTTDGLVRLAH
jgi:hypothetical protein